MVSNVAGAHQVVSGFGFRFDLHTLSLCGNPHEDRPHKGPCEGANPWRRSLALPCWGMMLNIWVPPLRFKTTSGAKSGYTGVTQGTPVIPV